MNPIHSFKIFVKEIPCARPFLNTDSEKRKEEKEKKIPWLKLLIELIDKYSNNYISET